MRKVPLLALLLTLSLPTLAQPTPSDDALRHLTQTVDWYRDLTAFDQSTLRPDELLYRDATRRSARQALNLAFDHTRAQADRLLQTELTRDPQGNATAPATTPDSAANKPASNRQRLARSAAAAAERVTALHVHLDQLTREISAAAATRPTPATLTARRDALSAELDLATARADALARLTRFGGSADAPDDPGAAASTLLDKLDALQRAVPDARADATGFATTQPAAAAAAAAAASPQAFHLESAGALQLLGEMFSLSARISELKGLADRAQTLRESIDKLRAPLRAQLQDALRRADALTAAPPPDDPAQLDARRRELETLAARFRQLSAVSLPLAQQGLFLDASRTNLLDWRSALGREYAAALRRLLLRLALTAAVIVVVVGVSVLWRRATFKYVHDVRRRRQFMLVRRIVIGLVIALVALVSFVTEFGSLATFAGILTAGIAVSLQTLILSGVAYFFYIGRYGVRVGDRVTVGNVTGDVVETGLFRLYLMELGGIRQQRPTGRVVVFSNSVLFQPSGFFKQLPGTDYLWHEVALTLAPDTDHQLAEKRLLQAVDSVYTEYRDDIERQHRAAARTSPLPLDPPKPEGRLRFVDAGLEFVLRYPVDLRRAADTDDQVTRRLLAAIQQEPRLRLVSPTTPKLQPAAAGA